MVRLSLLLLLAALAACALVPAEYHGTRAPREAKIVALKSDRPLIALALGSGGARGFAHVGVIRALEEAGIVPDIVTGSSAGAIVAALYAGGYGAGELEEIARGVEQVDLVDFVLFGKGWVKGEALQDFVNRLVRERPIEQLAKPVAVVATDARTGRLTVFNRGDTGLAVRASASVPNLFVPPVINGREYVDGGLSSPVPVKLARAMGADIVIAVDVSRFAQARPLSGAQRSDRGQSTRYVRLADELDEADVVIVPRTERTRMLDFEAREANIVAGMAAGREAVSELRKVMARTVLAKRRSIRARAPALATEGPSVP